MVLAPSESKARRGSARSDLVTSLLREAALVAGQPRTSAVADTRLARRDPARIGGTGAEWCREGGEGFQARSLDPARAVTRWYLRGKTGLEELLLQLYFGHLSLAEVEFVAALLWGQGAGAGVVREVVPGIVERIDEWLNRPTQPCYPYLFLRSVAFRGRRGPADAGTRIAAAVGINPQGYREALGIVAAPAGSARLWDLLLANLAARGMRAPRVVIGDLDETMRAAVSRRWGNCEFLVPLAELEREIFRRVKSPDLHWVDRGVTELKAGATRSDGEQAGRELVEHLRKAGYAALSGELGAWLPRYLAHFDLPRTHRPRVGLGRLVRIELKRVREQGRILGRITDERVVVLLAAANFRRQCRTSWNAKPVLAFPDRRPAGG